MRGRRHNDPGPVPEARVAVLASQGWVEQADDPFSAPTALLDAVLDAYGSMTVVHDGNPVAELWVDQHADSVRGVKQTLTRQDAERTYMAMTERADFVMGCIVEDDHWSSRVVDEACEWAEDRGIITRRVYRPFQPVSPELFEQGECDVTPGTFRLRTL